MHKAFLIALLTVIIAGALVFWKAGDLIKKPTTTPSSKSAQNISTANADRITTLAQNLQIPWSLAFLPDGSILVTERPGTVRVVDPSGKVSDPVLKLNDVHAQSEGGLLGTTLSPQFGTNHYVYFYYTFSGDDQKTLNRVVRYKFESNTFSDRKVIVDNIPGAPNHNGGRIKFGPDGYLYITAGDALQPSLAQNKDALAGKILRVTGEGDVIIDNPFTNFVYSFGNRNPQGLAWDDAGHLWATEHGNSAHDEVNLIKPGQNYGWPDIQGSESQSGMVTPVIQSGNDTWAPSGAAYLDGYLYFAGLRGRALFRAKVDGDKLTSPTPFFKDELGRIRDVVVGPNKLLYLTTSNRDGRGTPTQGDDKILIVNPQKL